MDCNCNNGKFWIGLGLGTVLGAVAYFFAKSEKTKEMRAKMCCAAHSAAEKAGEWVANVKECDTESKD